LELIFCDSEQIFLNFQPYFLQQADVVVVGLKWISDSFSVQLPGYIPLMVLHDPPGGLLMIDPS
jgi:hypothetical protein